MRENIQEFDVFTIPHSRMMQLVNSCNKNLSVTDFADNDALFALLSKLQNIFYEFKTHEDIEDEHIMTKLKSKLKSMAIYNSAVCNCHSNDEFTPLIDLVERGYTFIDKAISTSERITFGVRLRRALKQFTNKFIPHMKEEEEVFQPLLMEYFTPDELAEMKQVVIKLHLQSRKGTVAASTTTTNHQDHVVLNQSTSYINCGDPTPTTGGVSSSSFNHLPSEIMLKIFSHLSVVERVRIARVCKRWNSLVYDRSNWKELTFANWSTSTKSEPKSSTSFKDIEYIDESDEDEFDNPLEIKLYDVKTLQYWIKYLLPRVGTHLTKLDLSNCRSLNNNLARRIIQLCPNLTDLNLSYTPIGDNSFRGVKLDNLKTLNCEGCDKLSDKAFRFLLLTSILSKIRNGELVTTTTPTTTTCVKDSSQVCKLASGDQIDEDMESGHGVSLDESRHHHNHHHHPPSSLALSVMAFNSLEYINLSGVWSLTDEGLSFIASKYDLTQLRYLNLSGCLNLSGETLEKFLEESKTLAGENLYYCDNIQNGPMSQTANGCDNLGCSDKFCCRAVAERN